MSQPDLLDDLLTTNPNEPASKAVVLLLRADMKSEFKSVRAEMKSEFKSVRSDIGQLQKDMEKLTRSLDMVAEQVAFLVQRAN